MTKPDIIYRTRIVKTCGNEREIEHKEPFISIESLVEFLKSNLIELVEDDVSKQNNYMINGIIAWLNQQTEGKI